MKKDSGLLTYEQRKLIEAKLDSFQKSAWEPMEALRAIQDLRIISYTLLEKYDALADQWVSDADK